MAPESVDGERGPGQSGGLRATWLRNTRVDRRIGWKLAGNSGWMWSAALVAELGRDCGLLITIGTTPPKGFHACSVPNGGQAGTARLRR